MRVERVGSVRAVTDAQGQVIARHDFLPFGEELAPQSPPRDRRLFTGQERDFETALDYFHARQLRGDWGRFTTPDPLTDLAWTNPTLGATNAYGYVQSNPLGFIDPMGAQDQETWVCVRVVGSGSASCQLTVSVTVVPDRRWELDLGSLLLDVNFGGSDLTAGGGGTTYIPDGGGNQDTKKGANPCPDVPESPLGASATFNAEIVRHVTQGFNPVTKLHFFVEAFQTGGPFDYKSSGGDQYVDYGNWNFGYVCAANYSDAFCQSAAGMNRMWRAAKQGRNPFGSGLPFMVPPYGDQANDNRLIRAGLQAYRSGCFQ